MITDRNRSNFVAICCWLSLFTATATLVNGFSVQQNQQQQLTIKDEGNHQQDAAAGAFESTRIFNPRMDYNNEWRPVGRGDPLKNDPTYDYSPPALERVRYWADSADKDVKPEDGGSDTKATAGNKNDILLLGVSQERPRPAAPNALQNAKGELPLLQPKYSSIRRSYYAQQLPTHLMPPPMQALAIAPHNSLMKAAGEYRQSMPASFTASSSSPSMPGLPMYSKSHYSTMGTSPWMHSQSHAQAHTYSHSAAPPTTTTTMKYAPHSMPIGGGAFDSHHQESTHYLSYTRPSIAHTSEPYSPNSIRPSQNTFKTGSISPRKPWVHELLQKELIKSARPTMSATKYLMSVGTHPNYNSVPYVHPGISTTFAPVNFVTAATSTSPSRQPIISTPTPTSHTSSPVYLTSTALPTTTTSTTTTTTKTPIYSATRLLIPETSNIAFRPTVAPMEMTTDSLFAHYNQPDKPLIGGGPMYLIIEGHSKVKTYGKNELDPHLPKIVPIIPKREPIVRVADPNELRGSVETFQVKHLHTKKIPTTTTTTPTTSRMPTKATKTTTTTTKPKPTTAKPTTPKPTAKLTTIKTSAKPTTVKTSLKTSMTTTTGTTLKPQTSIRSTTISTVSPTTTAKLLTTAFRPTTKTSSTVAFRPEELPPTGMQGLLSLLDDSLSSIFRDEPTDRESVLIERPELTARVATKGETIAAEDEFEVNGQEELPAGGSAATELPPRGVRQVFDYDQLPDSRLKQRLDNANYVDDDTKRGEWLKSTLYSDDESTEYEDSLGEPIKRYDKVMDYDEDDDKRKEKGQEGEEEDEYEDEDDGDETKNPDEPIFEDVKNVKNTKLARTIGQEA